MDAIDPSLINWSRAQFALTAMYHWLFVPLTLGLGALVAIMETLYVCRKQEFWKTATRFWAKLFGINFAMGVATGIILEFEFGTNWSNYSWFVGDIFGAPLAIEGIVAFFLESTFLAVMFFGWEKVSRRAHLTATWMTVIGATLSAWWILVANAWMQNPVGMVFNPETVRNEMVDFAAVALSPTAVIKFCHTVASAWVLGSAFVVGVSCWYLLKRRHQDFSCRSLRLAAAFGLLAALLTGMTGHLSGEDVARNQPMKLAAMEGLYEGGQGAGLVTVGLLQPGTDWAQADDSAFICRWELPQALSLLATRTADGYVPGIRNLLEGGYPTDEGPAPSAEEQIKRGRQAIAALASFRQAMAQGDSAGKEEARQKLQADFHYFGYGYLSSPADLVPPVPLTFYSFRIMVTLGGYFILLFGGLLALGGKLCHMRLVPWVSVLSIPLAYLASEAGWIVAEVGRQPWAIQGLLPNNAAVSCLETGAVQTTFWIFLTLFTLLLASGLCIMCKAIGSGPTPPPHPTLMTYETLQLYWWFLVSLLGALLVFLMFVQGGQSLIWELGDTEEHKRMVLLATGRKWELTFTTLVVFGGAFFAAFPLFYSTSFGGAYWVWILILLCFVLQAVSYEFQRRRGNLLGTGTFRAFLFLNGLLAPLLLGAAVSTFFHGAEFVVHKAQITEAAMPVISRWSNPLHGLEAVLNPWNLCLGLAILFLSRLLALLYLLNNIGEGSLRLRCRRRLPYAIILFLLFFLPYMAHWLSMDGFAVNPDTGLIHVEATKYLNNLLVMPAVAATMAVGVLLVLCGSLAPLVRVRHHGIWLAGTGTVLTVLALLLCAGWNHTAYYPSLPDLQSSLHLGNSCSSPFTLKVMSWVSLLIPLVLGYIIWAWRALESQPITAQEAEQEH